MDTVRLQRSGLVLTRLGFGAAGLGNLFRRVGNAEARRTFEAAWAAGIRYFDTAPYYGFGLAERRLGDLLRERGETYVLATKVGRLLRPRRTPPPAERDAFHSPMPFDAVFDYSYDGVLRSVEDSLQRLGLARIDLVLMHDLGRLTHGDDHPRQLRIALDGGLRALMRLREEGVVRAVGLGVKECAVCREVLPQADWDCLLLAGRYSLLEQPGLDVLDDCRRRGVDVLLAGVFNSGVLAAGPRRGHYEYGPVPAVVARKVRRLARLCRAHGVALPAAALHFARAHPAVRAVLVGFDRPRQVAQVLDWWAARPPAALWAALRLAGLVDPAAPVPEEAR